LALPGLISADCAHRLKFGSSSRKEEDTVTASLDRPFLVRNGLASKALLISTSEAGFSFD
jgi:hypothetical protein